VSLSLPRLHNQASSFLFLDRHSNQGGEIRIPDLTLRQIWVME
jgi:hypothetical protein